MKGWQRSYTDKELNSAGRGTGGDDGRCEAQAHGASTSPERQQIRTRFRAISDLSAKEFRKALMRSTECVEGPERKSRVWAGLLRQVLIDVAAFS